MKSEAYTELICQGFCSFYKPGKEELTCETYNFLVRNLTEVELKRAIQGIDKTADFSCDDYIREAVCSRCDFLKEDCDFRGGRISPPCGGYIIVENLRAWSL